MNEKKPKRNQFTRPIFSLLLPEPKETSLSNGVQANALSKLYPSSSFLYQTVLLVYF